VKAVDTNIILRFILNDDVKQAAVAERVIRGGVFIPSTVLLETGWVLSARYRFARSKLADILIALLNVPTISVADEAGLRGAIEHFRLGADLADAIHLVGAGGSECFITFDRGLARLDDPPIPIELAPSA
jgi:predicted nucleic-acid-binding protein